MKQFRPTYATNAELSEQMFEVLKALNDQGTWCELASKRLAMLESDNAQLRYDLDSLQKAFNAHKDQGSPSDHERAYAGHGFPTTSA